MKVMFLTREYPPHVYGGAGVHVEYLAAELAKMMHVEVRCVGDEATAKPCGRVKGFPFGDGSFSPLAKQLSGALVQKVWLPVITPCSVRWSDSATKPCAAALRSHCPD